MLEPDKCFAAVPPREATAQSGAMFGNSAGKVVGDTTVKSAVGAVGEKVDVVVVVTHGRSLQRRS